MTLPNFKIECFSSREWKDGLLASILRKFCVQPPNINYDLKAKPIMKIVQMDGEVIIRI
jgi:hypothetical protein